MDYSVSDLTKAISMFKNLEKKDEHLISFTKENDGQWYVDFPDWPLDHNSLLMVNGADELCELLSYDGKHTKIKVYPGVNNKIVQAEEAWRRFMASRQKSSLLGGATYWPHFTGAKYTSTGTFWLCPVTLFVLGEYPKEMWIEPLDLDERKMYKLGLRP